MQQWLIIGISLAYLGLLFGIAYLAERRSRSGRSWVANPYIYALSLGVYCTAWTFYGSVGRAATGGLSFLPIFLGPSILAPLWLLVLRKMIVISKHQRITSVADFMSSRYGKSTSLGMLATLIAVFGVIPYISIQLKAIASSYELLVGLSPKTEFPFYTDPALFITVFLTLFAILFGTRHLDPNERHEGMVAAIAFESIFKLLAFMLVGLFVVYVMYGGFNDLFAQAYQQEAVAQLFDLRGAGVSGGQWFWWTLLSMLAIVLLPRQFHVAVVENTDTATLRKASWLFPLYLLLINLFVLPVAVGGLLYFSQGSVDPDTFVISLPLAADQEVLALLVALGGFSAASSMVIVAVIALSIMISNQLVLPVLFKPWLFSVNQQENLQGSLLGIRRVAIVGVLLLSYAYFRFVARDYALISIGLISFAGIAQFAPALFGGMYWKRATKKGAIAGLLVGFIVWAYTLPFPTLIETGVLSTSLLENGPWGQSWLRPYQLLGLAWEDRVAHAAFWSLLANSLVFFGVSLQTQPSPLEVTQADLFVDIYKYGAQRQQQDVIRREARVRDLRVLLQRFLGESRTREIFTAYERRTKRQLRDQQSGQADLINLVETNLAGSIGASSAKVIMRTITREDPIRLEEMFKILEQTQEIIEYSRTIERKSKELEETSRQLREANVRLQELDTLKAEFIATVTHELRTPITSIKSLSKILQDNQHLEAAQRQQFLGIIVSESERIARLINQVLDIEKLSDESEAPHVYLDVVAVLRQAADSLEALLREKAIALTVSVPQYPVRVLGNRDHLVQVVVNLLNNAIKFCPEAQGRIELLLENKPQQVRLLVRDNGPGIAPEKQEMIFGKFTQVSDRHRGKPAGSGLGLFITQRIVQRHQGSIEVQSAPGEGATFVVTLPKFLLPVDAYSFEGDYRM